MRQADLNPFSNIFSPQPWDPLSHSHDAQSQDVNETQTPPVLNVIDSSQSTPATVATPSPGRPRSRRANQGSGQKLRLLCREEWDEHKVYAKAQQRREQSHSKGVKPPTGMTPITINNHFPNHVDTNASLCTATVEPLEIPSPRISNEATCSSALRYEYKGRAEGEPRNW